MKTEWMYFMAGAGLMAAVMSFNINEKSSADCTAVATTWETGKGYLNDHEMKVHTSMLNYFLDYESDHSGWKDYAYGYKACLAFEGK